MVQVLAAPREELVTPTWAEFMRKFVPLWGLGQHVFIYGETRSGKTDLGFRLMNTRDYGAAFITKPRDPIFASELTRGYKRITDAKAWPPRQLGRRGHFLLAPKPQKSMDGERQAQREMFPPVLDATYMDGVWTVLFDETVYMSTTLNMRNQVSDMFYLGASNEVTGIACSQRPVGIPPLVPQSCKWAFLARSRREDDIKVLAELGYSRRELAVRLSSLRNNHDFLFVDPQGDLPLMVLNTHR